jgi:hypothetical protein
MSSPSTEDKIILSPTKFEKSIASHESSVYNQTNTEFNTESSVNGVGQTDAPLSQAGLDKLAGQVYADYPELKQYNMEITAVDHLYDNYGKPADGEWASQDKILIATSGRANNNIKATILHELLHVDASNHDWTQGIRLAYRFGGWPNDFDHDEIEVLHMDYLYHLEEREYLLPDLTSSKELPSLDRLSWRKQQ